MKYAPLLSKTDGFQLYKQNTMCALLSRCATRSLTTLLTDRCSHYRIDSAAVFRVSSGLSTVLDVGGQPLSLGHLAYESVNKILNG
jgi:hypothetical protein